MRPLAITLVAVLLAAGCSAQRRDKITVACGASERWCSMMVKRFSDATGVEADFVRLSSGEALERIRSTPSTPGAASTPACSPSATTPRSWPGAA
ncbi:hypothetical protein [Nonomuraea sp. NPDC003214]